MENRSLFWKNHLNYRRLILGIFLSLLIYSCKEEVKKTEENSSKKEEIEVVKDNSEMDLSKSEDNTDEKEIKKEVIPQVIPPDPYPQPEPYPEPYPYPIPEPDPVGRGWEPIEPPGQYVDSVQTIVEVMPEFPGGMVEMNKFIASHLKYPEFEKEAGIEGNVYVRFVVGSTGKIFNVVILKSIKDHPSFDKEVKRVIALMPDWKPGMNNGKPVPVYFTIPVKFRLD